MVDETMLPLHRRLFHWGPIIALSIVSFVGVMAIYCDLQYWPPFADSGGLINLIAFLSWIYLCLTNFAAAAFIGPGYVPFGWKPAVKNDQENLQFCDKCRGFKPPRAHHCSSCERCCMKMDHHCPWINNCCGHRNHAYFVKFLFFAVIGCLHAACILVPSVYYALFRSWYIRHGTGTEPDMALGLFGLLISFMSAVTAIFVSIAVGSLLYTNMKTVLRNRTIIEEYIVSKAERRPRNDVFVFPYDLGWKENFYQIFGWNSTTRADGLKWPLKDGCGEYCFTKEQLEQKRLKRELAIWCQVVEPYNGSRWIPGHLGGLRTLCTQYQFIGENRLPVKSGDRLLITRWRQHWCYAQLATRQGANDSVPKGWLPIACVRQLQEQISDELPSVDNDKPESESRVVRRHRDVR